MTGNKKWRKEGLGDTGESYIVGADYTMRSMSRLLAENAEIYVKKAEKTGLNKDIIAQIKNTGSTILLQTVNTNAAKEALSGKEDTQIMTNYLDIPVISSYAPLQIEGLQWVIISEISLSEAYASVYSFQKVMLIWGALIVLVITLVSMILSYIFIRPINILTGNARKISGGQIHGIVKIKSNDEFGELSEAFNEMVNSLQKQTSTIKEKNQENEKLLLSIFPDSVAKRLKNGEQDISDHVDNVTVLVSDIVGFTRLYETMDVNTVLTVLNDLVTAFDEATEKYGVEKVKTIGDNYIAVCGLSVPRLDHAKRMVDFAMEMRGILRKFNYEKGLNLDISIIVHSGDVIAGIVGRKKFSYDVWGEAVNTSNYIIAAIDEPPGEILVSHVVYQELYDIYEFEKFAEIAGKKDKKLLIWQLKRS